MLLLKPFIENCSLSVARRGQEQIGKLMANSHRDEVSYSDFKVGNIECTEITPRDELSAGVILYLHGGGYVAGSLDYGKGFGSALASRLGIRVVSASYRLAPENVFPAALDDVSDVYGHLVASGYDPSQILLCGESAGGGLCYSLCLKLREKGKPLPAGIIAISPWTDLAAKGASYTLNASVDPSMTATRLKYFADCYLYGSETDGKKVYPKVNPDIAEDIKIKQNPLVSPLYGDMQGMPPSLIFVGGDEIMLDDSRELYKKLAEAGAKAAICEREHMWHGYVLYCLPENDDDFDMMRKFVKENVAAQKKLRWMTLDNAAKIYPAARRRNWSNVFRLSATLNEDIDREALRVALDVTVRRFPSIAVRIKTGFFWYYLEEIPKAPDIIDEKPYPLSRMIFDDIRKCAFRVIVYKKRIAVEFFHAVTDGTGGLVFLKTLVAEYLYQKYGVKVPVGDGILNRLEEPRPEEIEDSFQRSAGPVPASRKDTDAYRITGKRDADGFKTNTTFIFDAAAVVSAAKEKGVTVTAYITAALMVAAQRVQEQRVRNKKRHKPIKVLLPVNLRKMFGSKTLRNFALYISPGFDPRLGNYTFDEICKLVYHQMQLQITDKNMAALVATNVKDEKPIFIRMMPLFVKNIVMKMIFDAVGERKSCFTFSNLGVVRAPEEFEKHVDRIDFVIGVQASAPYNISAITYGGKMNLSVIRNIEKPVLEYEMHRVFRELGLYPKAQSNMRMEK